MCSFKLFSILFDLFLITRQLINILQTPRPRQHKLDVPCYRIDITEHRFVLVLLLNLQRLTSIDFLFP